MALARWQSKPTGSRASNSNIGKELLRETWFSTKEWNGRLAMLWIGRNTATECECLAPNSNNRKTQTNEHATNASQGCKTGTTFEILNSKCKFCFPCRFYTKYEIHGTWRFDSFVMIRCANNDSTHVLLLLSDDSEVSLDNYSTIESITRPQATIDSIFASWSLKKTASAQRAPAEHKTSSFSRERNRQLFLLIAS
jgi:hypothetical protein